MANVEQISQVAMQVITYAGMAKSSYLEALKYYRENDQTAYEQSMSNGDESFSQAHEAHLQLLQQEMNTQSGRFAADMQVSLVNDGPVTFWLQV